MSTKPKNQCIFAIFVSLLVISCGQGEKKADDSKTADSATTGKTDTVQTAATATMIDAVKAAPGLYTTVQDTLGIRILKADYKPGDSSILHSHPDYALYCIEGGG